MRLHSLEKKACGANAYSLLADMFVRLLGKVCNEITSCFPCNESAIEAKVHCHLLPDIY